MSLPILVAVCSDPGGTHALAPVIKLVKSEQKINAIVYAYNNGPNLLAAYNIDSLPLPADIDEKWVTARLQSDNASTLVTDTSFNGLDWEKLFIDSARRLGIPSLAVLDFWSHYAVRFSDSGGSLAFLPDRIAVMDSYAETEMIEAGIPGERIV